MAYTKIHAIKATVDKAIDYICNPEKTDEKKCSSPLMPVLRKPQLMTSNIPSTTAGKTVPTKPII